MCAQPGLSHGRGPVRPTVQRLALRGGIAHVGEAARLCQDYCNPAQVWVWHIDPGQMPGLQVCQDDMQPIMPRHGAIWPCGSQMANLDLPCQTTDGTAAGYFRGVPHGQGASERKTCTLRSCVDSTTATMSDNVQT